MALRGKQKRYLRSEAHHMNPLFQVGKSGLNAQQKIQIGEALEKRELLKVSLLRNTDETISEVADKLAEALRCEVVQVIGRVLVLYRPSSKEKYQKISQIVEEI